MLKQPLFGEDSSPHITSMFLSGIITLIGWILFCILSLVIKFKPQTPQYKEVQIVLSSTPVEEKSEPSAVPELVEGLVEEAAAAAEESVAPEPVEGQHVETPKATPAPAKAQTQPAKTTDPSKKVDFDNMTYAKDYSDFSFNNTSSSSSKNSFDWSQFEDSDTENVQVSQKVDKVTNTSSISGSAASSSTANQRQTSSSSSSSSSSNSTPAASSSTSSAAAAIKNTTGTASNSSSSSSSSSSAQKFSSDLDITWNGGVTRKQIGSLSIDLKESGSDIKERKTTVTIEFTVDEKGYTIAGTIKITPESILPESVRKEVISEISKWRFIEGPSRSVATFEYTIEKR